MQCGLQGFATRGTTISNRLTAWTNLIKSTKPSGELTRNPKEYLHHQNRTMILSLRYHEPKKMGKPKNKSRDRVQYGNVSILHDYKIERFLPPFIFQLTAAKVANSSETEIDIQRWKKLQNLNPNNYQKIQTKTDSIFCGSPGKQDPFLFGFLVDLIN